MKIKYLSGIAALALAGFVSSCDDSNFQTETEDKGQLNTESITPEVTNAEMIISDPHGGQKAAARSTVDLTDYLVTVVNSRGEVVANWTYGTMPALPVFPVDTYELNVASGEESAVAWDAPYFAGKQSFVIKKNEITDVETVVCKLSNICVSVLFADDILAASAGDIVVTVTSHDNNSLEYTETETRKGYFQANGQTTFDVHFTGTVNGYHEDFNYVLQDVEAGQHRKVSFALRSNTNPVPDEWGNVGNDGDGIHVSTSVTGVDLTSETPVEEEVLPDNDRPGHEELPTDPENPDKPDEPTPPAGDWKIDITSDDFNLDGENVGNGWQGTAIVDINSTNGFQKVNVKIQTDSKEFEDLVAEMLCPEFDLATATGADGSDMTEILQSLTLPIKEEITGDDVTYVKFDITSFMNLLIYPGKHQFVIDVTDKKGNTASKTLTIVIN